MTLPEFLAIVVPLWIIMDPIGNLPLFMMFTRDNTAREQRRMALQACGFAVVILLTFMWAGDQILGLFGITMPAFQIAGGFIFGIYALQMLALIPTGLKHTSEEDRESQRRPNIALVPLAVPMLAGPGSITAVLVQRQSLNTLPELGWLMVGVLVACAGVYAVLHFAAPLSRLLGVTGIRVISRLMGLLLAVIAVQFMVNGVQAIM